MAFRSAIHLLLVTGICLLMIACGRSKKDHFNIKYPFIRFEASLSNILQSEELYYSKQVRGGSVGRTVDSTGIVIEKSPTKDANAIDVDKTMADPWYFFSSIGRYKSWDLNFGALLSAKWQDTTVEYDLDRVRQHGFQEAYVFGIGKDSEFYKNAVYSEIEKDGHKLIKIDSDGHLTYTGMVGKYWFMLQIYATKRDSALMQRFWNESHFY